MRYVPLLCAGLIAAAGCSGLWPSEMDQQPSVQALMAPRPAPEGSVPVGGVEHLEDRQDDENLTNPLANDPTAVTRGKALFAIHCAVCHADDGHGNGRLSKVFPPAPDLRYRTICDRTDGFIYGTITAGGRAMPSQREGLTSGDRWALVSYVRDIQRAGCVGEPAVQPSSPGGDLP
jgi:mono/diheme cytochrome c family protein